MLLIRVSSLKVGNILSPASPTELSGISILFAKPVLSASNKRWPGHICLCFQLHFSSKFHNPQLSLNSLDKNVYRNFSRFYEHNSQTLVQNLYSYIYLTPNCPLAYRQSKPHKR